MDDTETLIAIVSSLLAQDENHFSQDEIMDALIQSNGDVDKALQHLRSSSGDTPESSRKRKRVDLQSWLNPLSKKGRIFNREDSILVHTILKKKPEKPPSSSNLQD